MDHEPATSEIDYGVISTAEAKSLTGYELIKRIRDGILPVPPIAKVFHFRLTEVEPGQVVFTGQPSADYYNPTGSVHGGFAATLLDSCMGCAIHSALPAGMSFTTLEIKVSFLRPMLEDTGPVRALGKTITVGKRVATAEGRLVDAAGKLYAHGTTTCLIFPL
jgi:uncharacterized protein (TIGR00369 family)